MFEKGDEIRLEHNGEPHVFTVLSYDPYLDGSGAKITAEAVLDHPRRSVAKLREETKSDLTYDDIAPGVRVRVVTPHQDGWDLQGKTGVVVRNTFGHLGIHVRLDERIILADDREKEYHGFEPEDLVFVSGSDARQ